MVVLDVRNLGVDWQAREDFGSRVVYVSTPLLTDVFFLIVTQM